MGDRIGNYDLILRWMFRKLTYTCDKIKKIKRILYVAPIWKIT